MRFKRKKLKELIYIASGSPKKSKKAKKAKSKKAQKKRKKKQRKKKQAKNKQQKEYVRIVFRENPREREA